MEVDGGEVLDLFFVFGFGERRLQGVGGDAVYGVVEDWRAVDGLIEVAAEAGVGGWCGGVVGIAGGGEGGRVGERHSGRFAPLGDAGVLPLRLALLAQGQNDSAWFRCGGDGLAVDDGDLLGGAGEVFGGGGSEAVGQEIGAHGVGHGVASDEAFERGERGGGFAVGDAAVGFCVAEPEGPTGDGIVVGQEQILETLSLVVAGVGVGAIEYGGVAAEDCVEDVDLGVRVDAFVEP